MRTLLASAVAVGVLASPAVAVAADGDYEKLPEGHSISAIQPEAQMTTVERAQVEVDEAAERIKRQQEDIQERIKREREAEQAAATAAPTTAAAPTAPATGSTASPELEAIAACESGGDPSAVSADGQYHGKYQFSTETWAAVGGSGDPAAASEAEQDMRAQMLYSQQGTSPWPVCGG